MSARVAREHLSNEAVAILTDARVASASVPKAPIEETRLDAFGPLAKIGVSLGSL